MADTNTDTVAIPKDLKGRQTLKEQGKSLIDATEPVREKTPDWSSSTVQEGPTPAPLGTVRPNREDILDQASDKVSREKDDDYGPARESLERIALLWTGREHGLAGREYTAADVAQMMALVKISRLAFRPEHEDSWIDLVGYGALGGEVAAGKQRGGAR